MLSKATIKAIIIIYAMFLMIFFGLGIKSINSDDIIITPEKKTEKPRVPKNIETKVLIESPFFNYEFEVKEEDSLTEENNIIDLIDKLHDNKLITYEQVDLLSGTVIEQINNVIIDEKAQWNVYINGEKTQISPSKIKLTNDTVYKLKFE